MDSVTQGTKVQIMGTKIDLHELYQVSYVFSSYFLSNCIKTQKTDFFRKTRRDSLTEGRETSNSHQLVQLNKLYHVNIFLTWFPSERANPSFILRITRQIITIPIKFLTFAVIRILMK